MNYQFRSDGTCLSIVVPATSSGSEYHWKIEGNKLTVSDREQWWTDLWQRLSGTADETEFQLVFHDENSFEIYSGEPDGELVMHRVVD